MSDWQDDALCREVGTALFFPTFGADVVGEVRRAKSICDRCTVTADCLAFALEREGDASEARRAGVWGGTTPRQRWRIARERQLASA